MDISITQIRLTLHPETSTVQTQLHPHQQNKQEVQSIGKPKPKGVHQRDFTIA